MVKLEKFQIKMLKGLIGHEINGFLSDKLYIKNGIAGSSDGKIFYIRYGNVADFGYLFIGLLKSFNNGKGEMFYDYTINKGINKSMGVLKEVVLKTSAIKTINVYGRPFENVKTNDLFLFNCVNGEQVLFVFDSWSQGVKFLFSAEEIIQFFRRQASEATINHKEIRNNEERSYVVNKEYGDQYKYMYSIN